MAPSGAITASDDAAINQQSRSAFAAYHRNLHYLLAPSSSTQPARFRTRALLRSLHYLGKFILYRLVRYAKYAAVAFAVGAIGAGVFGSVVSGVGFIVAPTGILGSIAAAGVWGTGRFIARRAHKKWIERGGDAGETLREQAEESGMKAGERKAGVGLVGDPAPW